LTEGDQRQHTKSNIIEYKAKTERKFLHKGPGNNTSKPVGDRDHEVLGMGSFGENTQLYTGIK
jgi:hypothetical protein